MYDGLDNVELQPTRREESALVTRQKGGAQERASEEKPPEKIVIKRDRTGRRSMVGLLAVQSALLSLLLLVFAGLRYADTQFTDSLLEKVQLVTGMDSGKSGGDPKIKFVGGVFSERKCVLPAPFSVFSFDVSGANLKLVGLAASVRPCAAGEVTGRGESGALQYVEIAHEKGVVTRYYAEPGFLVDVGQTVTRDTILAAKAAYSPILLNVLVDGKLLEDISVNADMEIECVL